MSYLFAILGGSSSMLTCFERWLLIDIILAVLASRVVVIGPKAFL